MNLLCLKSYFAEKMSGVSNIDMMEGETEFPEDILDDDDYSEMPELTESPKKTGVSEAKVRFAWELWGFVKDFRKILLFLSL